MNVVDKNGCFCWKVKSIVLFSTCIWMTDACIVEIITNDVFVLVSLEGSAAPAAVWPLANSYRHFRRRRHWAGGGASAPLLPQNFVPRSFHWGTEPKYRRPRVGWGSWRWGSNHPPHQSAVRSLSGVRGRAPIAQRFSTIFNIYDGLFWHYNIVNCGLSCSHWGQDPVLLLAFARTPISYSCGTGAGLQHKGSSFKKFPLLCAGRKFLQWCNQDFFSRPRSRKDLNFKTKTKTKTKLVFKTKTKTKILPRPRPSVVLKTKTKTKTLHLKTKTKTFLWCILEADRKAFFSFSAVNENTDENEIPFTAENETKTKMDIQFIFRQKTKTKVTW